MRELKRMKVCKDFLSICFLWCAVIPPITFSIILTLPHLGTVLKEYTKILVSSPGRTVVFFPNAFKIGIAICEGVKNIDIFILARCSNPLFTGPGAAAKTSTPYGLSSTDNASAKDCT